LVVIFFKAHRWCAPSTQTKLAFVACTDAYPAVSSVVVDMDESQEVAFIEAHVTTLPNCQVWRNNKKVGYATRKGLESLCVK
jgi:hypothetical protein